MIAAVASCFKICVDVFNAQDVMIGEAKKTTPLESFHQAESATNAPVMIVVSELTPMI